MRFALVIAVPTLVGALGLGCVAYSMFVPPRVQEVSVRVAGADRVGVVEEVLPPVNLEGTFTKEDVSLGEDWGTWAGFRGDGTGVVADPTRLAKDWRGAAMPPLWETAVGEGYAGVAIREGRVYLLDYDQVKLADALRCLSLADGKEIWRRAYSVEVKRNHGMTRTVPAVGETVVVTMGPKCDVLCVDRETGDYKWGKDLVAEYGTKVPPWYAGQCPLIEKPAARSEKGEEKSGPTEGGSERPAGRSEERGSGALEAARTEEMARAGERVILAPAGKYLMVALDSVTGREIWHTPNPRRWSMTHSSILPVDFAGRRMYVYCGSGGVCGVDAATGQELWCDTGWRVKNATVPTPVDLGEGRILLSGGYAAGAHIVQLTEAGGKLGVTTIKALPPEEFGAEQQTPIFCRGYVYGVIPGGEMVCLDREGNTMWRSGGANRFGLGPYVVADGAIYAVNDKGAMTVVEASEKGFKVLGRGVMIAAGNECWGPLALAGGRIVGRDLQRLVCVDAREDTGKH